MLKWRYFEEAYKIRSYYISLFLNKIRQLANIRALSMELTQPEQGRQYMYTPWGLDVHNV